MSRLLYAWIGGLGLLAFGSISAATITVTTLDDVVERDDACSLREAMLNAENADQSGSVDCVAGSPDGNLIVFAPALAGERIVLNLGPLPTITRNLDIQGPVPRQPEGIIISAGGQSRILDINGVGLKVTLDSLSLVEGRTSATGESGAAIRIRNYADVTLQNMRLHENQVGGPASDGGAIDIEEASLTVNESELSANFSTRRGGAIHAKYSQILISDSMISDNASVRSGGGIYAQGGDLQISGSTISSNEAQGEYGQGGGLQLIEGSGLLAQSEVIGNRTLAAHSGGGGLSVWGQAAELRLIDTKVNLNYTLGPNSYGGGIHAIGALTIINGEVSDNRTEGESSSGGGIYVNSRPLTMTGGDVENNRTVGAEAHGGGIYVNEADIQLSAGARIRRNKTEGNDSRGGGMAVFSGNIEIHESIVEDNVTAGAGSSGGGIALTNGDLLCNECRISGNEISGDAAHGGALHLVDGDALFTEAEVGSNRTEGLAAHGGALYVQGGTLTFSGLLESNNTFGEGAHGGAILVSEGSLALDHAEIRHNETSGLGAHGGALHLRDSDAIVSNCLFLGNAADGAEAFGGAIYMDGGTLSLQWCYLDDNSANGDGAAGGALFATNADLSISQTTWESGSSERGGAMYLFDSRLHMSQSNFTDVSVNSSDTQSAVLEIHGGESEATLVNTLFTASWLPADGAVIRLQEFASLRHVTIANNSGSHAIRVHGTSDWTLRNSVIVHSGTGPACSHASTNPSGSLATDASCGATAHDAVAIGLESTEFLKLEILAPEDFPVSYRPISADGLARNAGGDCASLQIFVDQIGQQRPGGGSPFCDAGAYESQAPATIELSVSPAALQFGSVPVGQASEPQFLTLINTGQATVEISAINLAGSNPADFLLGRACIGPLLPGENCAVPLRFEPAEAGVRTATIQIDSNAPGSPQSVALSGTGTLEEPDQDHIFNSRFEQLPVPLISQM